MLARNLSDAELLVRAPDDRDHVFRTIATRVWTGVTAAVG